MMLNEKYKGDAFRLAAVLYADNNYEVKPKTILRKIIESLFLFNNNVFLSYHEIIDLIEQKYDFIFLENEVEKAVKSHSGTHFLIAPKDKTSLVCLDVKRLDVLQRKVNNKNIDYFIKEFLSLNSDKFPDEIASKETIYRFLYEGFNSNISSFNRFIDVDFDIEGFISNLNHNFNRDEAKLINEFLKWDNNDKDKSVFDISSFALEYCLITNKKSSNIFQLHNLKNKSFYLDTNVIIRAIGINGENRKKRSLTFFDKLREVEEKLIITKYTDEEFKATVNYYIGEIEKKLSPKISSKVFLEYSTESDFYKYYFTWKDKRTNHSLELFETSIIASYEALKRKYKIFELNKLPYDEYSEIYVDKIEALKEEIYERKRYWAPHVNKVNYESVGYDARNIFLVDYNRGNLSKDIFQTKHFFISSDQLLKKWDLEREGKTPTVVLPSHWLTILLRYHSRSKDDFKSFVSFISLSYSGSSLSNKNLAKVLNGISEITTDVEEQSLIANEIIKKEYDNIVKNDWSDEKFEERVKEFAKTTLENKVENLKNFTKKLEHGLKESLSEIRDLKSEKNSDKELKGKYETLLVKNKMSWYKGYGIGFLILCVLCLCFVALIFLFKESKWNLVQKLCQWANSLQEDSIEKLFAQSLIYGIPIGLISLSAIQVYKRLINKKNIRQKRNELIENLNGLD